MLQMRIGSQFQGSQMGQRVEAAVLKVMQTEIGYVQHLKVLVDAIEAVVVERGNRIAREHQTTAIFENKYMNYFYPWKKLLTSSPQMWQGLCHQGHIGQVVVR